MDQATNEKILKCMLDSDHYRKFACPADWLMEQLPGLSEDEIRAAVADLRNQGYLAVIYSDNTFTVMLNSKAHGYFREKEERVAIERTKRNEERSWNLKMMGISYSLGLISGVILMWIKAKVFL